MTKAVAKPKEPKVPMSNSDKCKAYRQKRGKVLPLPVPPAMEEALATLMERFDYTDVRELFSTAMFRLVQEDPAVAAKYFKPFSHFFKATPAMLRHLADDVERVSRLPEEEQLELPHIEHDDEPAPATDWR